MRQRRERAHASYTARKNKLEKAERADEAAAEIEVPEDDVPDPERSTLSLALSAVALRAQAQYHSLGAAIETDLGAARRAEEAAFEADRAVTEARKALRVGSRGVPGPVQRRPRGGLGAAARAPPRSTRSGGGARREVLDDFRGSIGYGRRPLPPRESPSRRRRGGPRNEGAAAGTAMLAFTSPTRRRLSSSLDSQRRLTPPRRSSRALYPTSHAADRRAGAIAATRPINTPTCLLLPLRALLLRALRRRLLVRGVLLGCPALFELPREADLMI